MNGSHAGAISQYITDTNAGFVDDGNSPLVRDENCGERTTNRHCRNSRSPCLARNRLCIARKPTIVERINGNGQLKMGAQ